MMTREQREMKVGDAILLERAVGVIARNTFPNLGGNARAATESLRILARQLRKEGETGEPAH